MKPYISLQVDFRGRYPPMTAGLELKAELLTPIRSYNDPMCAVFEPDGVGHNSVAHIEKLRYRQAKVEEAVREMTAFLMKELEKLDFVDGYNHKEREHF